MIRFESGVDSEVRMSRQAGFFDLDERYAALSAAGDLLDRLGAVICSGKSGLQRLVVTSQEFIRLGTTEAAMKGTAFLLGLALTGATAVGAISGLHAAEEKTKFSPEPRLSPGRHASRHLQRHCFRAP